MDATSASNTVPVDQQAGLQGVLRASLDFVADSTPAQAMARLGRVLRRAGADAAMGLIDKRTGFYNHAGMVTHGEVLLNRARTGRRPLSMVLLDFEDLLEVRKLYDRKTRDRICERLVTKLRALVGSRGLVARTGKTRFTVLMPGCGRERALQNLQRVLGSPARIEFDAGREEIVLVPDVVLESTAGGDESMATLYSDLCRDLAQQRDDESRRRHYLQRERERHSRPTDRASLPSSLPAAVKAVPAPTTVRVPLGSR